MESLSYRIRVRGNSNWNSYSRCILAVSVGQPCHEGAKLQAVIEWISANYKECIIDLSDSLQRYNYDNYSSAPDIAHIMAHKEGSEWLSRNAETLKLFQIPYRVIRWDHWLSHQEYSSIRAQIESAYIGNSIFRMGVESDIEKFMERRTQLCANEKNIVAENSKSFILEECAAHTLLAREFPGAKVYPSHQLNALKILREELVSDAPKGLANENYVRINLERKTVA